MTSTVTLLGSVHEAHEHTWRESERGQHRACEDLIALVVGALLLGALLTLMAVVIVLPIIGGRL